MSSSEPPRTSSPLQLNSVTQELISSSKLGQLERRVLQVLVELGEARPRDISVRVGADRRRVCDVLRRLTRRGLVVRSGDKYRLAVSDPKDARGKVKDKSRTDPKDNNETDPNNRHVNSKDNSTGDSRGKVKDNSAGGSRRKVKDSSTGLARGKVKDKSSGVSRRKVKDKPAETPSGEVKDNQRGDPKDRVKDSSTSDSKDGSGVPSGATTSGVSAKWVGRLERAVLEVIVELGEASPREVQERLGVDRRRVHDTLKRLVKRGVLVRDGDKYRLAGAPSGAGSISKTNQKVRQRGLGD
jgi:Predicted transcriptional regulators